MSDVDRRTMLAGAVAVSAALWVLRGLLSATDGIGTVEWVTLAIEACVLAALVLDVTLVRVAARPGPAGDVGAVPSLDLWIVIETSDVDDLAAVLSPAMTATGRVTLIDCCGSARIARVAREWGVVVRGVDRSTVRTAVRQLLLGTTADFVAVIRGSAPIDCDELQAAVRGLASSRASALVAPPDRQLWRTGVEGHLPLAGMHPGLSVVVNAARARELRDEVPISRSTEIGPAIVRALVESHASVISSSSPLTEPSRGSCRPWAGPAARVRPTWRSRLLATLATRHLAVAVLRVLVAASLVASPLIAATWAHAIGAAELLAHWSLVLAGVSVRASLLGERQVASWRWVVVALQAAAVTLALARAAVGELDTPVAAVIASVALVVAAAALRAPSADSRVPRDQLETQVEWAERVMLLRRARALGRRSRIAVRMGSGGAAPSENPVMGAERPSSAAGGALAPRVRMGSGGAAPTYRSMRSERGDPSEAPCGLWT